MNAFAEHPKSELIIRGSDNYPPFEFINESEEPDGFNVDIIRTLMKELGYDYELKLENWNQVVQDIQDKKTDVVIGMIYSPERAMNVRFTLPTCIINRNVITRKSDSYKSLKELEGKEVIVEKGGWFHRYLLENKFSGKIIESEDVHQSLLLLASGRYDAMLASELVGFYAMQQAGIKNLKIGGFGIAPQNYSIVVNPDKDELLYELNIGLQNLKLSGVYDQIYNKWFGIYEARSNQRIISISLVILLVIAVLFVLFVWLLRNRIARATRLLNNSKQEIGIAIDAGRISAWTYIIQKRVITSLHGDSFGGGEEIPIEHLYDTIHPEDIELVRGEFEALSSGMKLSTALSFRIKKENTYSYVETKMLRVEASKELPCRIVGTLKDVTGDVLMRQNLEEYRLKSDFIIRTNGIIMLQYNLLTHTFVRINDDLPDEHMEYTIDEYMAMVYPEDAEVAKLFIAKMDKAEEFQVNSEFRITSDEGKYEWFNVTATAYKFDKEGRILSYMGLRRNNTKWKMINNDLVLLREKAEAANRLKSAFLANMSHEIRTPLNAIVGFSELIADMDDGEEKVKFIDIVKTNNALLLQLINDILDLSRIEAGYISFNRETFNFSDYFQELAASLRLKESDKVKLICLNHHDNLKVCSDRNRIAQVVTNFVTNAFKFTTEGRVTLDYLYDNDGVKVSVTDTGIGISPENQLRVFERFEKINDFAQGTGLGLSICKVIIEALSGKIGVESEPGRGSTFWFWLPCNVGVEEQQIRTENIVWGIPVKSSPETDTDASNPTVIGKKTVLVAEDIDNNFIIINTILKGQFNVLRALNGVEAVEKTREYNPDFILMDMKMPIMGGLEATKEIRKFDPKIPIIALTAYVFDTNKQDALSAGCSDFLTKPLNQSVLIQVLNKHKLVGK